MKRMTRVNTQPTLESLVTTDFIETLRHSDYAEYIDLSKLRLSNIKENEYSKFTLDEINSLASTKNLPNEQDEALVIDFTATYVPTGVSMDLASEWMIVDGRLIPLSSEMSDSDEFAYEMISEFTGEEIPDAYYDDEGY